MVLCGETRNHLQTYKNKHFCIGCGPEPTLKSSREVVQESPQRKPSRKTHLCSNAFLRKNNAFGLQTTFFDGFNVFMSFLAEKWYRTNTNLPQKQISNPKRAKLDQNSDFGHVRTCQGQSRRTSPCQQSGLPSFFVQTLHPSNFYQQIYHVYKILCFIKQIYHSL